MEHFNTRWHFSKALRAMKGQPHEQLRKGIPGRGEAKETACTAVCRPFKEQCGGQAGWYGVSTDRGVEEGGWDHR